MNTDAYSLSDSYVSVGGDSTKDILKSLDSALQQHYQLVAGIMVVLAIALVWLYYNPREKFNPTATLRMQSRDGLGEGADGGADRSKSVFAQQVQSGSGALTVDPSAATGQPGSLGWQVLHSGDFDCNKRVAIGDDAWAWMQGVSKQEGAKGGLSDNDFSRIAAGH